jgi:hypothetical protein
MIAYRQAGVHGFLLLPAAPARSSVSRSKIAGPLSYSGQAGLFFRGQAQVLAEVCQPTVEREQVPTAAERDLVYSWINISLKIEAALDDDGGGVAQPLRHAPCDGDVDLQAIDEAANDDVDLLQCKIAVFIRGGSFCSTVA